VQAREQVDGGGILEQVALDPEFEGAVEQRPVVGLAGVDVHAKLALWDVEPGDNRFTLPFPGYEATFRTLSVHVRPDRPLSGDAAADGETILQAIRAGHLYTAIDAIATPASFEFSASSKDTTVRQGGTLPADEPVRLRVRSNAPREFTTTVWEGSRVLTTDRRDSDFTLLVSQGPAVYRVEIRASDRPGEPLWIISNPIYVGIPATTGADAGRPAVAGPTFRPFEGPESGRGANVGSGVIGATSETLLFPADAFGWTVEHDPASRADVEVRDGAMRFSFSLAPDPATRPHVALTAPPHPLLPNDRVTLRLRADRPMRMSVQLRTGVDGTREERWQRSVYVDTVERQATVSFDDMKPVGAAPTGRPPLADAPSLILVIDTTNTKAGSSGQLWIKRVALGR
jgi:hypothetical protein